MNEKERSSSSSSSSTTTKKKKPTTANNKQHKHHHHHHQQNKTKKQKKRMLTWMGAFFSTNCLCSPCRSPSALTDGHISSSFLLASSSTLITFFIRARFSSTGRSLSINSLHCCGWMLSARRSMVLRKSALSSSRVSGAIATGFGRKSWSRSAVTASVAVAAAAVMMSYVVVVPEHNQCVYCM